MAPAPFLNLRNRLLSSAEFRRKAEKLPFGQWFARRHANRLFRIAGGFIHSQVLLACVRLDLFEVLRTRPLKTSELAARTGLPEHRLRHLLSAAAALDLLTRRRRDRFGLGPLGAAMNENDAVRAFVLHHDVFYEDLVDPIALFAGDSDTRLSALWAYASSAEPATLERDDVRAYTALMSQSQVMVAEQVLDAFSFADSKSLIDIGGGGGAFARAVAARWPELAITVADLPPVADIARQALQHEGLERRIDVIGIDATTGNLPGTYDVASLVRILHDHDDDRALDILKTARSALSDDGLLLVAEPLAAKDAAGALNDAYFQVYLLAMGTGRPRRYAELKKLLKRAGFRSVRRRRTRVPLITSVIVAKA